MPRNFKEAMVFTCLMCGMMVFGMSMWNLVVAGAFSWQHVFLGFVPGFIVAFILDTMIVGPIAKKNCLWNYSKWFKTSISENSYSIRLHGSWYGNMYVTLWNDF